MADLYAEIVKALSQKEKVALATIVQRVGSAPRAVGAKYLVKADGSSYGSIGGGCVEAEVWQGAQDVIEKGKSGVLRFKLTAEQLAEGGLICGGNIDIFVEPLREEFLGIFQEILKIQQKGGGAILSTLISVDGLRPKGEEVKMLIRPSGEKIGLLRGGETTERGILREWDNLLEEKKPKTVVLRSENQELEVLLEPILSEPTVYIFGGGHVSQQIAPLARRVQFKVVVIDDREVFANRERFPEADALVVSDFETCFDKMSIDESSYIVIVTRGHLYDGYVLEQAIKSNARYIGMIGSKKKIHTLYQNLMGKGVPKAALDRVYAPIGIDINSETPEEIAVSIVAELIKVRGQKIPKSSPGV